MLKFLIISDIKWLLSELWKDRRGWLIFAFITAIPGGWDVI